MEKIAIIGISCLLPGAETPEQYWQNLIEQKNLTSKATAEQMGIDAQIFYDPIKGKTDKYYCLNGGYIRDFQFDASGYQIPSELLKNLDNIYQWSLYVSKQALQDSGYLGNTAALAQCGVILGNLSFPTRLSHHLFAPIYHKTLESAIQTLLQHNTFRLKNLYHDMPEQVCNRLRNVSNQKTFRTGLQTPSGTEPLNALISGYPATLIAQSLSLSGPRFSLDAACASSLYAVKLACQYLLSGKADLMLAGAVSGADPLFINMGFSICQAYPENSMSRPLDKSSGGLVAGEGAGMLILKRYSDAIRDGDNIYASIGGIGLSNDGKGKFILNPNQKGQILALERAYTDAGVNPNSIDYIECHATGTLVGDITELNSMEVFFGKHQATPLIGSVKSNLGHLLTTAGMASLIKVILSMNKGIIPATINLTEPLSSDKGVFSAEQMVRTTTVWPQEIHTKRAAVSAFGFGGTNAHLILSFPRASVGTLGVTRQRHSLALARDAGASPLGSHAGAWEPEEKRECSTTKLAIVGMDAFFGACHDLEAFNCTVYNGIQHFIPVPPQRWQGIDAQNELLKKYGFEKGEVPLGAYIQDFEMDFLHFKIPPSDDDQLIPQQLLMLKVADNAIRDAGLIEGGNVAVIVAMGTELALHQFRGRYDLSWQIKESLAQGNISLSPEKINELEVIAKDSLYPPPHLNQYTSVIGNLIACRIAAQWDFTGPAFTVSAEENSVFRALEIAQQFLASGEVNAVVVGAVDLAGGFESMLLRHQLAPINSGVNTLSYDEKANGWMVGEGAGVVVLKRLDTALQNRIYAVIDAISLNANNDSLGHLPKTPTAKAVTQSCRQAFKLARIKATDIGYMEVFGSGVAQEDEVEIKGLSKAYQFSTTNKQLITAIGSVKANIGHTYAASGIASLIKTALCLHHRYIPAVPQWEAPKMPEQWQSSPFYVATESKTWFLEEGQSKRVAAINGLGLDGTYAHLILSETLNQTVLHCPAPENITLRKSIIKKIILGGHEIHSTILTTENRKSFDNMIIDRNEAQQQMMKIIQLQIAVATSLVGLPSKGLTPVHGNNPKPVNIVWDETDLLEFAEGKIANVFGSEYAIIDSYSRRVRLPTPPYLLVSRVTKLNAEMGNFKPSTITTEYDIPHNAWYSVDGQIPWAVAVEPGQCDLLLISYLGIDFDNQGVLVYRRLDCTMTFLEDIPTEGDTLRYDISINSFVRHGNNLLFFFSYECFVGDKMVLTMDGGCAGFFTDDELDKGKGVVYSKKELAERNKIQKQQFEPLLICQKSSFDETDMIHLTEGNIAACFGDHYWQAGLNPSLRIPPKEILMIDRVTSVEFNGGAIGLGLVIGEKILEPEHWYFPCHFLDDQVMAGSLMAEGCCQLLQFYLLYLGFQTCTTDARFQPIPNPRQVVRCRGQVTPISATLIYRLEITELGLTPKPYAVGDVEIILNDKIVVHFKDVGLQLSEKNPANSRKVGYGSEPLSRLVKFPRKSALLNEEQVQEFCIGSASKCFGPEYEIYDTGRVKASRLPNTHLNLLHRVLEVKGKRHQLTKHSTIVTEYDAPTETWYYRQNSSNTLPYSIFMEIALQSCGFLSAYLGTTLLYPDESLYFRNLDGQGRILKEVDIRGKTVTNTARLLSSSNIQGMIIQRFDFKMVYDSEIFYQGEATFGNFSSKSLANQVGLDGGKNVRPWIETANTGGLPITKMDFKNPEKCARFYHVNPQQPHYRLAQHQLDLLNEVKIVEGGGCYQQGYIYARKKVKPTDWYFKCHFHQDPVMPGSLGVEAIMQAMQVYALQLDLGKHLKFPRFGQVIDHEIIWKYRGQIPQPDEHTEMYLEVHLSKVEIGQDKVTLIGDASLWKPNLRIYEVKNVAICLLESPFLASFIKN